MGYDALADFRQYCFLVTGGAGFIGSNLCEALLELGSRVRCVDNFSMGKRENVAGFLTNPLFELIEGDVRNLEDCERSCEGVDFVLHQAAWGSVPRSLKRPVEYCANNVLGAVNLFEGARRNGVKRVVFASSSSVYGDDPNLPKIEGREGKALSPYAVTKVNDEAWARQYALHYGLETIGLRYFNVFGRRQDPYGAYAAVSPRFIKAAASGERATIFGDGKQSRDFTYIENVIQANLKACFAPSEASGEAFNIASGGCEVLLDVGQAIYDALGLPFDPIFAPERPGDIKRSAADVSKARRLLGYEPEYDFRRGLAESIKWYRENL